MNSRRFVALALVVQFALTSTAFSWPAETTSNVNMRQGPSTQNAIVVTLKQGALVEVDQCDDSGSWCAVTAGNSNGFVSGRYLNQIDDPRRWPRDFKTDAGALIRLHQPQITEWENYEEMSALIAAEFRKNAEAEPAFGVIEIGAETYLDRDADEVVAINVAVKNLNFSTLSRDELTDVALRIGKAIPTDPITLSLARVTASIASYQQLNDVEGLNSDPPTIFVSEKDARLLQTNGEPVTAAVGNVDGLSFVINTNWDLFKHEETNQWLLRDDASWLAAKDLAGPWEAVDALPDALSQLPDDESWKDTREAVPAASHADGAVPDIFYSDAPAELIITDGPPALEEVPGTELHWVSNTEHDLFFHAGENNWYFLTSGRWFRAASLEGPWAFATPDLPDDFRKIPDDTPYYTVRASVPGTSESAEARLKASIPQLARVEIGSIDVDVAYSGDPSFEEIDGTSMTYAVNASEAVIKVGDKYYVVKDGVWFVGDSPNGPFEVATKVPEVIYTIPSSSPVYNVTYVRVYDTTPGAVWVGVTMGYYWGYLAWNTYVYGSGWYHPPYWYYPPGGYPIYHPRPVSYGFGAYYDPARGTYGRYGYAYGPYRGITAGARYNPATGTWARGAQVYGPGGTRGFVSAYNPRTGTRAVARGGTNAYGSWGSAGVKRGSEWARARGFQSDSGEAGVRWQTSTGRQGGAIRGSGGDVYAGRDGNVYRRQDGQWQKYDGGDWNNVRTPDREGLSRIGGDRQPGSARDRIGSGTPARERLDQTARRDPGAGARPALQQRDAPRAQPSTPRARPSVPQARPTPTVSRPQVRQAPQNVARAYQNRQVGNARAIQHRQVQQHRPQVRQAPRPSYGGGISYSGGGRSFGGGGRGRGGGRRR